MSRRIPSANPYNIQPGEDSPWPDLSGQQTHINNRNRGLAAWAPRIATAGVTGMLGASLGPLLFGGMGGGGAAGAGASAPSAASAGSAPTTGMNLGSLLDIGNLAVGGLTNWFGAKRADESAA